MIAGASEAHEAAKRAARLEAIIVAGTGPNAQKHPDTREGILLAEVVRLRGLLADATLAAGDPEFAKMEAEAEAVRNFLRGAVAAGARTFRLHTNPTMWIWVSPSARPDCPHGHWQVTRFDSAGPVGHTYTESTPEATARELWSLGYTELVPGVDEVRP